MATNDITSNVVSIAAAQTALPTPAPATAGSSGGAASQPQTQLWQPANGSPSGGSSGAQQSTTEVKQQIDEALKNTGVKAELDNEQGIGMVVRLVEASSGQLLMQLPPQAVLDLVEQVTSQIDLEMSEQFGSPNYTGRNIDQVA